MNRDDMLWYACFRASDIDHRAIGSHDVTDMPTFMHVHNAIAKLRFVVASELGVGAGRDAVHLAIVMAHGSIR